MNVIPRSIVRHVLASSSAASVSRPLHLLPSVASASRLFSSSPSPSASGQGSRELKIKKKTKGSIKHAEQVSAKKNKKGNKAAQEDDEDDDDFDTGRNNSRRGVSEDTFALIDAEVAKADEKMGKFTAWLQEKYDESVARGRGKVDATALDSIKVTIPKSESGEIPLNSVATVAAKGNTLLVSVFDEEHTKHVERAIHSANIPGLSPTKGDARTIRVTVPRPSTNDRAAILKQFTQSTDQTKVNIRNARTAGMKALPKGEGVDDMQVVTDKHNKTIDTMMQKAKKELSD